MWDIQVVSLSSGRLMAEYFGVSNAFVGGYLRYFFGTNDRHYSVIATPRRRAVVFRNWSIGFRVQPSLIEGLLP